jgi:uncharacterized membrane protein
MIYLIWLLRILHIVSGVFWVGGALAMNVFVGPSLGATGQAGKQFAGYLVGKTRFTTVMTGAAMTAVTAGLILYIIDSAWFTSAWERSGPGIGFGIGALFGLIGLVTGVMNGNNIKAMGALGAQIQGQPTSEQAAKLAAIQNQQSWVIPVNTYSLLVAVTLMAVARYLHF